MADDPFTMLRLVNDLLKNDLVEQAIKTYNKYLKNIAFETEAKIMFGDYLYYTDSNQVREKLELLLCD